MAEQTTSQQSHNRQFQTAATHTEQVLTPATEQIKNDIQHLQQQLNDMERWRLQTARTTVRQAIQTERHDQSEGSQQRREEIRAGKRQIHPEPAHSQTAESPHSTQRQRRGNSPAQSVFERLGDQNIQRRRATQTHSNRSRGERVQRVTELNQTHNQTQDAYK